MIYRRVQLALVALGIASTGCGAATQTLIQCKADALRALPADVGMVTPYDIDDLYDRLKACHAPTDAGAP